MSDIKSILDPERGPGQIAVDRVISELRSGRPALVHAGRSYAIVTGVESLDGRLAAKLGSIARGRARLVLPAPRLRRLGLERANPA